MSPKHELLRTVAWGFVVAWVLFLFIALASSTDPPPPRHTTNPIIFHDLKCYPQESADNLICDYPEKPR
jgi:hypothetical protein